MNAKQRLRSIGYVGLIVTLAAIPKTVHAGTCFVWRVTNTKASCYLVGTLHALTARDWPLPKGYYQAFQDSKRLVFEIKPDPQRQFVAKFVQAATYANGDLVERHVHPKTWEIIRANFGRARMLGKPFRVSGYYVQHGVEGLRPWAIAGIFYGIPGYSDVSLRFGVDEYFRHEGKRKRKELAGLEAVDEHVEVLQGMNDIESELMLLDAIVHRYQRKDWEAQLRSAWKRGDIAGVREYMARFGNLNPGAYVRLLDERNIKWIPQIKAEFNSGKPASIVVGSGHMLGPNGLIALLRKQGYQFEQL